MMEGNRKQRTGNRAQGTGSKFANLWILSLLPLLLVSLLPLTACASGGAAAAPPAPVLQTPTRLAPPSTSTPFPTRPAYEPGERVDYTAQTGDTLPALAARFNTTVDEILEANPFIPADASTMPPGMPMQIPIYYLPFWGSQFRILPDSLFVNGPAQSGFDAVAFVEASPGWLREYKTFAVGRTMQGGEIIQYIADNFSISPRLLLALLEYQLGALSRPDLPPGVDSDYPLGHAERNYRGLYMQLVWAANILNNGYYGWRSGQLLDFDLPDGAFERYDPWQNAATVALQHYFIQKTPDTAAFRRDIGPDGFLHTYRSLFGDPWAEVQPHIPGSLRQPEMVLPFEAGKTWAYTGGPHTGWGSGAPFAAVDFAPPSVAGGCTPSDEWVVAVADGLVIRHDTGVLMLDLDGDGDEHTGWVILYLHIATRGKAAVGATVAAGQPIGHPSCEGGHSTGTHIHIARKYNGEWILADSPVPLNLEGWIAENGDAAYEGTLRRYSQVIKACVCSNAESQLTAGER